MGVVTTRRLEWDGPEFTLSAGMHVIQQPTRDRVATIFGGLRMLQPNMDMDGAVKEGKNLEKGNPLPRAIFVEKSDNV